MHTLVILLLELSTAYVTSCEKNITSGIVDCSILDLFVDRLDNSEGKCGKVSSFIVDCVVVSSWSKGNVLFTTLDKN